MARRRALAVRALRAGGAAYLGQAAGRSWEHGRYQGPYLRDTLMEMGAMVETLETSHTWSRLGELHGAVAAAIRELAGRPGHARASSSATSRTPTPTAPRSTSPSSPARRRGAELEQWAEVKRAACEAIVANGGTITHHHAVGRDHAPYMEAEVGRTGLEVLRAVKEQLDPTGIMNPGKLAALRMPASSIALGSAPAPGFFVSRFCGADDRAGDRAAQDVCRRCRSGAFFSLRRLGQRRFQGRVGGAA